MSGEAATLQPKLRGNSTSDQIVHRPQGETIFKRRRSSATMSFDLHGATGANKLRQVHAGGRAP